MEQVEAENHGGGRTWTRWGTALALTPSFGKCLRACTLSVARAAGQIHTLGLLPFSLRAGACGLDKRDRESPSPSESSFQLAS